jgi:hypothetical protein
MPSPFKKRKMTTIYTVYKSNEKAPPRRGTKFRVQNLELKNKIFIVLKNGFSPCLEHSTAAVRFTQPSDDFYFDV